MVYASRYWGSAPFHEYSGSTLHIPTQNVSGVPHQGEKSVLEWTTPNWTSAQGQSSSTTKEYLIIAFLNPYAPNGLFGDGRADNLSALAVREKTSGVTITNGFTSSSMSDYLLSKSYFQGGATLEPVVFTYKLDLKPNTTYLAWLFHGVHDYGSSPPQNGGVNDAIITVQGLGV